MFQRGFVISVISVISVIVGAVVVAGCASKPKLVVQGRVDVRAESDGKRVTAAAKVGNEVAVTLPPVRAAGTQWTIVFNDGRFLRQLKPVEQRPDGSAAADFVALAPGRRMIRFFALPPTGREAVPSQSVEIIVEIE